jgi:hypothetical protein
MKNDNHTTLQCSTHALKTPGLKVHMVSSRRGIENRNRYQVRVNTDYQQKLKLYPRIMFAKLMGKHARVVSGLYRCR